MKKAFMKSAIVALAIMLVSVSAFAVDFSACTNMGGDLWGTDGFQLSNTDQKDGDLLTVDMKDEMWGSYFRLYTQAAGDSAVLARDISIWVKPLDMLKITVGKIGSGIYTEQLNWWHVPTAAATVGWSSDTATSGAGINLELTPADGFWILAGISPGYNALMALDGANLVVGDNTNFGVAVKYSISGFGSIAAAYRNNGGTTTAGTTTWNDMSFRIGADVNAVSGLYAFIDAICRIDAGATSLSGVTIDNFVSFSAGAFNIKAELPITIRLVAGDVNYMTYDIKAGYKVMDNLTPFLRLTQDAAGIPLDNISLFPTIQIGADYNIAAVGFMTAIKIALPDPAVAGAEATWSIPFTMRVSW